MPRAESVVTEQSTNYIKFRLLTDLDEDGVPESGINVSAIDHLELILRDNRGTVSTYSSGGASPQLDFESADHAAAGSARYTPGTADLLADYTPYQGQFKVYWTPTRYEYIPNDGYLTLHVNRRLA